MTFRSILHWPDAIAQRLKHVGIILFLLIFSQTACSRQSDIKSYPETNDSTHSMMVNKDIQSSENQNSISAEKFTIPKKDNFTNSIINNKVHDLGNGFQDHGVAVPVASSRGTVATTDGQGHNIILVWLYDHRGTYSLLMIDTDNKKSDQFFLPFSGPSYASILSSKNRYYTHFKNHFIEFDPNKRKFTFIGKTSRGTAMSMTEDDDGVIWAALMPDCSLVSYNPKTHKLTDYGTVNLQKARQLPRSIAADDEGWIYVTAGSPGKEQILAFNPKTKKIQNLQRKANIPPGGAYLLRENSGKVYGRVIGKGVVELKKGNYKKIKVKKDIDLKSYISGSQKLYHNTFPDGKRIRGTAMPGKAGFLGARKVTIEDPSTSQEKEIAFDYKTEGADLMEVATGPGSSIIGGSTFPMSFFQYYPNNNRWIRQNAHGQYNVLVTQGDVVFIGRYPDGHLLKWYSRKNWKPALKGKINTNPQYLAEGYPSIYRPHDLLAYPDGRTIIMVGRPSGALTGGGLLFWDKKTQKANIMKHIDVLPNQSTRSLAPLPGERILGGTTIRPGDSGGKRKAKEAELYIMNVKSRKIEWAKAMIPGVVSYQDLCVASNSVVLGVAGLGQFFVFDTKNRKILKQVNLEKAFGSKIPITQGQRSFIKTPQGEIYLLLEDSILKIDTQSYKLSLLAKAPEKIIGGGAYLNGQIYYIGGGRNRIQSYKLPNN